MNADAHPTTCKCGQQLDTYVQQGLRPTSPSMVYGTCKNPRCSRFTITLPIEDLAGLTEADVARFKQAVVNR